MVKGSDRVADSHSKGNIYRENFRFDKVLAKYVYPNLIDKIEQGEIITECTFVHKSKVMMESRFTPKRSRKDKPSGTCVVPYMPYDN